MAGVLDSISTADQAVPGKLHHCSRAFGLLSAIQPDDDCQLARIGERLIVLPSDLDLSAHLGQRIGIVRIDDKFLCRRLA
jgi:hypothetical protein